MKPARVAAVLAVAAGALFQAASGGSASSASPHLSRVARFSQPVMALQAPGEPTRLYVVEQEGYVRVLDKGKRRTTPFLDLHTKVSTGGERGLLGIAFPSDYATRHKVYANYTNTDGNTTIVELPVANGVAQVARARQLLQVTQPYPNHNGGNLQFGPDGLLYVGLGDGGSGGDPEGRAQNPGTLLGKLFTLDVRSAQPSPKLVGIGLRNPWRYSFDRRTGDLWIGDVGQDSIEEIDVVRHSDPAFSDPGSTTALLNFGWDVYEGSKSFENKPLGPGRLVKPVTEYPHSLGCSVTGGYVYRGRAIPSLRGRYLYADYCSGTVWSMPATGGQPRVEPFKVPNPVSFGQTLAGELYVVSQNGAVYRIVC